MGNVESIILKDSGGTEADVTASNALKVDGSAVTQPISSTQQPSSLGQKTMANSFAVVLASDQASIPVGGNQSSISTGSWTSATGLNTAVSLAITGYNTISVVITATTTISAGAVTFEVAIDGGTTWIPITLARIDSYTVESVYTLVASINRGWTGSVDAFTNFRVRLSTAITGSATVGVGMVAQTMPIEPIVSVGQATASNLNAQIMGELAHDAADSGNPVKIGGQARTTNPTAVADADRVNAMFDDVGKQVVIPQAPRDLVIQATTTIAASTSETTILATAGAGVFHDVTAITISNTSAIATRVDIRDATAGTVRWSPYIPAGATWGAVFQVPITQTTANNNWTATCITSLTDLRIFIQAVKNV